MLIDDQVMNGQERISFRLRSLYSGYGYERYRMSKFEEYDLYSRNKDFLFSEGVITFTDTNGRLMALKPDVTLSIVKNRKDTPGEIQKLYYHENVYRVSAAADGFREQTQVGLECMGAVDSACIAEVLRLAAESLKLCSNEFVLEISHVGILSAFVDAIAPDEKVREEILHCAGQKNLHGISRICRDHHLAEGAEDALKQLLNLYGTPRTVMPKIRALAEEYGAGDMAAELGRVVAGFTGSEIEDRIQIDFSATGDVKYYNGIAFKGFISGIPGSVLSGGQYDTLMKKMGRKDKAIGFAVFLDMLERLTEEGTSVLNIALPKGRLGEKVYAMFAKAGFECPALMEPGRKLIFDNEEAGVRYFWVKPSDVAIYVERGAADIGVAGKDILLEYRPDVYELLDLNIGKCRMAVAAPAGFKDDMNRTLRVATKFSRIARDYYTSVGRDIDIIHLNGSIEIAPILGLSDVIVDIVETGTTLRENNLNVIEEIVPISARLIANKSGFKFRTEQIEKLTEGLRKEVQEA